MILLILTTQGRKIAEADITGFSIKEIVELMRAQRIMGRKGAVLRQ